MKSALKSVLFLAFSVVFAPKGNAQAEILPQQPKRVNYYCEVSGGYLAGAELRGLFHVKNGLSFGKHFYAALGVGLETYVPSRYIPVFVEGRYKILDSKTSPFISISAGYLHGIGQPHVYYPNYNYPNYNNNAEVKPGNGFTMCGKIGFQHAFTPSLAIVSGIGWRYAYARQEGYNYFYPNMPTEISYKMNRFELTVGLIFK